MLTKTSTLVCVVLGATLSIARADEPEAMPGAEPHAETMAASSGGAQVVLPKGRLVLDAYIPINLSADAVGKPISISPDLWYGVTDDITVGLIHSGLGRTGVMGSVGTALCLTGSDNGCAKVYDNAGVEVRYKLKSGPLAYAVDGGLHASSFDPFTLSLKVGLVGRWAKDKIAVDFAPNVSIGLTERSQDVLGVSITTNPDVLSIPVTGSYEVAPKAAVSLQVAPVIPFEDTGDTWSVPLSIGGHYAVNESLTATLAFTFPRLIAGSSGSADYRVITLGGTYAF
jgi:hypothetical protein